MSTPVLQARGLTVGVAGAAPLLNGLDLDLHPGQRVGLVGASGSGKSMVARALLGLLPEGVQQRAGTLLHSGHPITARDWPRLRGRQMAYVFQDAASSLHPLKRVGAQLHECLRVHAPTLDHRARLARIGSLLEAVGLPVNSELLSRYPHQLSGGQRQRVLLALTLLPGPTLLIADEPTSALDPVLAARVCALLAELVQRLQMTLLFISHDLARVASLCDTVHVLDGGQIVESGPAQTLLTAPRTNAAGRLAAAAQLPAYTAGEPANAAPVLEARSLTLTHAHAWRWPWQAAPVAAVRSATLALARGGRIGIVGSSGSGKSTLLRGLLRLLPAKDGTLSWFGQPLAERSAAELRALRARVQLVFQDPYRSLDPLQRVDAMLREALSFRPAGAAHLLADPAALLAAVGLPQDALYRYPAQFSGGQRQRLAIARALATAPDILLCDEATSALDSATQAQILDLLDDLARRCGLSLIFVAHDLDAVRRLCDTLIVLDQGDTVEAGPCQTLLRYPQSPALRALLAARPASQVPLASAAADA